VALRAAFLTALLLALAPATAAAAPPWQAAERVQAALFDAQTALLLDGRAPAGPSETAAGAFRGPLRAGLRRDAPGAYRDARAALRQAPPLAAGSARPCCAGRTLSRSRPFAVVTRGPQPAGCCSASSARPPGSPARAWMPRPRSGVWPAARAPLPERRWR
jgi:hypothetical protein